MGTTDTCPRCHHAVVSPEEAQPWCPACEWNLGAYDPQIMPARGWRWMERLGHRLAFRLDRALFDQFSTEPPSRPGWTPAGVTLVAFSLLLWVLILGGLVTGGWLVATHRSDNSVVGGVVLVAVAVWLRPRLGRRPARRRTLRRDEAPTLFALVDRVAAAVGTPAPDVIAVGEDFSATTSRFGLRRRTQLTLGMPLWLVLGPAERVALLSHELGNQVSGDPTRSLLVQPALTTFRTLALATGANQSTRQMVFGQTGVVFTLIFQILLRLALWPVSRALLAVHLGLAAVGLRDHQRAEYLADQVAVDVAGSAGTAGLLDVFVLDEAVQKLVTYHAETRAPVEWRGMVEALVAARRGDLPVLRQLSIRRTDLWRSHPPAGYRTRMVAAWPTRHARVRLDHAETARIDAELAPWYRAVHRLLLGTRDFRVRSAGPGIRQGR